MPSLTRYISWKAEHRKYFCSGGFAVMAALITQDSSCRFVVRPHLMGGTYPATKAGGLKGRRHAKSRHVDHEAAAMTCNTCTQRLQDCFKRQQEHEREEESERLEMVARTRTKRARTEDTSFCLDGGDDQGATSCCICGAPTHLRVAVLMFVRIVNGTKMFVKTHVGRVQLPHSGAVHPRQLLLEEDNNELALDNPWSGIKV